MKRRSLLLTLEAGIVLALIALSLIVGLLSWL